MYLLITDGGDRNGTYGSFAIHDNKGKQVGFESHYWGFGDHNQAEYWALLGAVRSALALGIEDIMIFTDSETLVEQLNRNRPIKKLRFKNLTARVFVELKKFKSWKIIKADRSTIKNKLGH